MGDWYVDVVSYNRIIESISYRLVQLENQALEVELSSLSAGS